MQYSTGLEYEFHKLAPLNFSFLAGYKALGDLENGSLNSQASGWAMGFSTRISRYKLDYAYDQHSELGNTHRFTFGLLQNSPVALHMDRGGQAFERLDDASALRELQEATYLSPGKTEAYHLLALTYARMRNKAEAIRLLERIQASDFDYFQEHKLAQLMADIVSSGRRLQDFCHTKEIADSPFFNIFSNLFLSPFSREEAMTLICEPSKAAGCPLAPVADEIISMAGYSPFFIQVGCSAFFEYAIDYAVAPQEAPLTKIHELFLEETREHFQYIWDRFDESERRLCLQLVRNEALSSPDLAILRGLVQQGYVMMKADKPELFSSLFVEQVEAMESRREMEQAKEEIGKGSAHVAPDYIPEAIVIVDIVGSTGISHRYGAHLLRSLYGKLEAIGFEVASLFHDKYRRSRGDGLMLTFNTVEDAVNYSLEMQNRIRKHNRNLDATHQIPLRFVIHFGETINDEKGERYGDTVNMTFKVEAFVSEALVGPDKGGLPSHDYIIVTEQVYRGIASKAGVNCRELGVFELPGLTGLHRLYELKRKE